MTEIITQSTEPKLNEKNKHGKMALLGYSIAAMEAAKRLGYDFVSVVPPDFVGYLEADGLQAVSWDFDKLSEDSGKLYEQLAALNVRAAVPLYEETVEWAGMINSHLFNDPRIFNKFLLFRDKGMMKRKAQMSGIRVGVFEEVDNLEQAIRFFDRIKVVLDEIHPDEDALVDPIHLKPTRAAGSVGHMAVSKREEVENLPLSMFPCMAESHLDGQEFSVEAFIHDGEIYFMNINQYVHLGYSQFTPGGHALEKQRPKIRQAVEKLIKSFDFKYGVIHPEYFVDANGELNFGEVAARVPGGHIFELIERAYGFDPFEGFLLCCDRKSTPEELKAFFPSETDIKGHAGNLLVYPQRQHVTELNIPDHLLEHPYFEKHSMFEPVNPKVAERVGFGDHYGTIFFYGDDPDKMDQILRDYEKQEYYV